MTIEKERQHIYQVEKDAIDDPAADYLPFFEMQYPSESSETITIRHLLSHSSGLSNNVPEVFSWIHFGGVVTFVVVSVVVSTIIVLVAGPANLSRRNKRNVLK